MLAALSLSTAWHLLLSVFHLLNICWNARSRPSAVWCRANGEESSTKLMFTNASLSQWAVNPIKDCTVFSAVQVSVVNDMDQFILWTSSSLDPANQLAEHKLPHVSVESSVQQNTFSLGCCNVSPQLSSSQWCLASPQHDTVQCQWQ